mgnify:CR=1 FL=1
MRENFDIFQWVKEVQSKKLKMNKDLSKKSENSEEWHSIKSEIEKTDKKIDDEVSRLPKI